MQDDLDNIGDIGDFDDHLASYMSNDEDVKFFAPSKISPAEQNAQTLKGISIVIL